MVESNFGIEKGHLETVHSYTNDQNLLDNIKKPRRGRSAAINMVITSTSFGKTVTKVIPTLEGKLTKCRSCSYTKCFFNNSKVNFKYRY